MPIILSRRAEERCAPIAQDGRNGPGCSRADRPVRGAPCSGQGVRVKPFRGLEPSTLSLPFARHSTIPPLPSMATALVHKLADATTSPSDTGVDWRTELRVDLLVVPPAQTTEIIEVARQKLLDGRPAVAGTLTPGDADPRLPRCSRCL